MCHRPLRHAPLRRRPSLWSGPVISTRRARRALPQLRLNCEDTGAPWVDFAFLRRRAVVSAGGQVLERSGAGVGPHPGGRFVTRALAWTSCHDQESGVQAGGGSCRGAPARCCARSASQRWISRWRKWYAGPARRRRPASQAQSRNAIRRMGKRFSRAEQEHEIATGRGEAGRDAGGEAGQETVDEPGRDTRAEPDKAADEADGSAGEAGPRLEGEPGPHSGGQPPHGA